MGKVQIVTVADQGAVPLMHLQDTKDRNGNMKTLLASGGIKKGLFSVTVSLEEKLGASDHSKALMTESQAILHLPYCFLWTLARLLYFPFR